MTFIFFTTDTRNAIICTQDAHVQKNLHMFFELVNKIIWIIFFLYIQTARHSGPKTPSIFLAIEK